MNQLAEDQSTTTSVLELLPHQGECLLHINCGQSPVDESYHNRFERVVAVESDPAGLEALRGQVDSVIQGNVDSLSPGFDPESFDVVLCEHGLDRLADLEQGLASIHRWLRSDGQLVAYLPTARNHAVVQSLMHGSWKPQAGQEIGRRFFTRREIERLFDLAEFRIDRWKVIPGEGHAEWVSAGRPAEVRAGSLCIGGLPYEDAEEFHAAGYVISASPIALPSRGLTSIVIPTHNELGCTKACLDSIRTQTYEPYELVVVDNGSTDGTVDYLRQLEGVKTVFNSENRGFAKAVNQGIAACEGEHIVLLNNDTIVTSGWLRRMLAAFDADDRVGLAGPYTNNVSGEQQVPAGYQDLSGLEGFAWDFGKHRRGRLRDTDRLVGFCLMISRQLIDEIGVMDEQFEIGNFEDDDYCRRALQAGYRAVIVEDVFLHHVGSQTFRSMGVDFGQVMAENQRKFEQKWSTPSYGDQTSALVDHELGLEMDDEGALLLVPKNAASALARPASKVRPGEVRLSLCMIVRDNEDTIRPCLEGILPWVDEAIIVDTGSEDRTPDICRELGARVEYFEWCDDFSRARNESLKYASGEWIFWMDSDDTIPEDCGRRLRELADENHADDVFGYVMQVRCPMADSDGEDYTEVDQVKMFRNRPDLRFEFRIHEQIIPAINRAGGRVEWCDGVYNVHSGSDPSKAAQAKKHERDFRILNLDLKERPEHPFILFNFGMTYADGEDYENAVVFLRRSIAASQPQESQLPKAYSLLVSSLSQLRRYEEALAECEKALGMFPDDKELRFRSGIVLHELGRLEDAIGAYQRVLRDSEQRQFKSVVQGINGYKTRHNLAIVYDEMGELNNAIREWDLVTQERPYYRPGWHGLALSLRKSGNSDRLFQVARQLDASVDLRAEAVAARAFAHECCDQHDEARQTLERAVHEFPDDPAIINQFCQLMFERFHPTDAEPALTRLCQICPDDGAAHHNLGTVYRLTGRSAEAVLAFRQSLEHRPDSPGTFGELAQALADSGDIEQARSAVQDALARWPGEPHLVAVGHDLGNGQH